MKRLVCILLAAILLLTFTGCDSGKKPQDAKVFTIAEGTQRYKAEVAKDMEPASPGSYALDREDITTDGVILSLAQRNDGTMYALEGRKDGSCWIRKVDIESITFSDSLTFPVHIDALFDGNAEYPLFATDGLDVYGLNPDTAEATKLFNTTSLGLTGVVELVAEDGTYLVYTGSRTASRVVPDDGEAVEKTVLTLATVDETMELVGLVADFNASHTEYEMELKVYGEEGLPRLLTELAAGELPDILNVGSYDLPTERLIEKGYLEDLYTWLDNDPELSRESLMPNVREAFEHDGALYEAFSNFRISTFISGPQEIGNDFNQIIRELLATMDASGEAPLLLATGGGGFPYYLGLHLFDQFVDWESGTCQFDSEEFVNLLRYAAGVNSPNDYPEDMILDGSALLYMTYAGTPSRITLYRMAWGDDYRIHGLPGLDGTSSNYIIRGDTILSICSTGAHKDVCWELIREMWKAENQIDPYDSFARAMNTPSNAEAFEAVMEEERTMEDEGSLTSGAIWTEFYDFPIKPMEEDIQIFIDLVRSTNKTTHPDYTIMEIVQEESEALFAGDKTVEEVAANIQARASIYVAEQMH